MFSRGAANACRQIVVSSSRVLNQRPLHTASVAFFEHPNETTPKRKVDRLERWILTQYTDGKYKSSGDVPTFVSESEVSKARTRFRIHFNILMMVLFVILASITMYKGRSAEYEDSLEYKNKMRHEEWKRKRNEE